MNFYKLSYLFLLAICLVSCGGLWQKSSDSFEPSNNVFELQNEELSSLRQVFRFKVSYDNGLTYVLDDRVSNVKVRGTCSDNTTTMHFEQNIASNRTPVGASFPPEFLLDLFKSVNIWSCGLIVYPLDEANEIIQDILPGTISVNLRRDMSFGIEAPVGTRRPSMGYILDDVSGIRIVVDDIPDFEDPRDQTVLSFICDNGEEELLRRQGVYNADNTNLVSGDDRLVNVFTEEPFEIEAPSRNINTIKDWLGENDSNCIITNSIEGSPYLLWSHGN